MISLPEFPAQPLLLRYQNSRDAEQESPIEEKMMPLSELYDEALLYASDLHRTQVRKGSGTPYIAHLLSVSSRVLSAGGTEVQAIAGLLHDAAEDQGGQATLDDVRRRFGSDVAQIVADCTDSWSEPKPAWRPRKELYLSLLPKKAVSSLLVSLADKVDNAEAILNDYRNIGDDLGGASRADAKARFGITVG